MTYKASLDFINDMLLIDIEKLETIAECQELDIFNELLSKEIHLGHFSKFSFFKKFAEIILRWPEYNNIDYMNVINSFSEDEILEIIKVNKSFKKYVINSSYTKKVGLWIYNSDSDSDDGSWP